MEKINDDPFNPLLNERTALVMYLRYCLELDYQQVAFFTEMSEEGARHVAVQGLKRTRQLVF